MIKPLLDRFMYQRKINPEHRVWQRGKLKVQWYKHRSFWMVSYNNAGIYLTITRCGNPDGPR